MIAEEKTALVAGMDQRRERARGIVEQLDTQAIVYQNSGWRVQDIVAHLVYWESLGCEALEAFNRGEVYSVQITDLVEFNDIGYHRYLHHSAEQVYGLWHSERERLKAAVLAVPEDHWQDTLDVPWAGRPLTPQEIAKGMGIHERHHMRELEELVNPA